jgi:predicted RNA-binding protein YlxR (DUF448 family)
MAATQIIDPSSREETGRRGAPLTRRCIVSNQCKPVAEMVRFVVGPDNTVVPDITGRLPGRGIWLSADRNSIKTACARSLFNRAARRSVHIDAAVAEQVEGLLARQCIDLLGLARRAGQAVSGYEKTRGWLRNRTAALLLAARDGAVDGREKLRRIARDLPIVAVLDASELGIVFDRERAVHVAVAAGGLAEKLERTAKRLSGFRPMPENRENDE